MIAGASRDVMGRCAQTLKFHRSKNTPQKVEFAAMYLEIPFLGSNYGGYLDVSDTQGGIKREQIVTAPGTRTRLIDRH